MMSSNFIWFAGALRSLKEGWGSIIYFHSTECTWGSGFGVMFVRERPYGRWLWILNMAAWVGWCSNEVHGAYGVGLGRISGGFGGSFTVTLDLMLVMVLELNSGMMCGVGIRP